MQGVRERVLRIGRLYQVVRDDEPLSTDICVRWLVSRLKVDLRPIWSPASEALSSLAQRFGDVVWDIVFSELQQPQGAHQAPDWMTTTDAGGNKMNPWEERSWKDPSAHRLRGAVATRLDRHHQRKVIISEQNLSDRFDPITFEAQILITLGQCTSLAEKHNRELVTYFLTLAGPDAPSRLQSFKLRAWLKLFSKFSNPKVLHATDMLRKLYRSLISYPDQELQVVSLSCLLAYKSPTSSITRKKSKDRHQLVDVIVRLLYGLMLEKKGRSRGGDRRAAVLTALAGCADQELSLLVDLMLNPMESGSATRQDGLFSLYQVSSNVSFKQQTGYLTLLGDVLKNLGSRLTAYWPALLGTTLELVANAQGLLSSMTADDSVEKVENEADEEESEIGELADFFRYPVEFEVTPYISPSFSAIFTPRLELLDQENIQAPSALLEFAIHLVQHDPCVLPAVLFKNLTTLVERTKADAALSSPITQRQISILSGVARYAQDSTQALTLLDQSQTSQHPGPYLSSADRVVKSFLRRIFQGIYELLSLLFMSLRFTSSRLALTSTFNQLAVIHPSIQELASLLKSLNACSSKRIDEPDFDRQLTAFTLLNEQKYAALPCREWLPVISNALYFVQDTKELAIRDHAAFTLRRFIDLTCDPSHPEMETLFMRTALPALKIALKSKYEPVRAEALVVLLAILRHFAAPVSPLWQVPAHLRGRRQNLAHLLR
ncbi:hypothetical protein M405DRAFT_858856 [Rhizopogon salebrosus TDB-379]|nr:hypothetical protein M405DRAFT_858856 [Rhizopogon salebrosus TDB-379]